MGDVTMVNQNGFGFGVLTKMFSDLVNKLSLSVSGMTHSEDIICDDINRVFFLNNE